MLTNNGDTMLKTLSVEEGQGELQPETWTIL